MRHSVVVLLGAAIFGGASLPVHADEVFEPTINGACQPVQSSTILLPPAKCLRNPYCRKAVAERAKKLRERLDKWINEFTFGALQQFYDLLGEAIGAKDNGEAIARLDRLEQLLEHSGLLSADVRHEIEELRSALRELRAGVSYAPARSIFWPLRFRFLALPRRVLVQRRANVIGATPPPDLLAPHSCMNFRESPPEHGH